MMTSRSPLPWTTSEPYGFVYLGIQAAPPQKAPVYRQTTSRRQAADRLIEVARGLDQRPDVHSTRVFRTHLVPPLEGAPRHDLAMLIRTNQLESLETVRASEAVVSLGATELLVGSNAARIGDTEADENAVFLFNHFTVASEADPVKAWTGLTDWYTSRVGVDNSTALRPTEASSRFALVNYVRLPSSPPLFLLNQVLRPSFHRIVRGTLKRNKMRALPGFYQMLH